MKRLPLLLLSLLALLVTACASHRQPAEIMQAAKQKHPNMVYDKLPNRAQYAALSPAIAAGLDFLQRATDENLPAGSYEILPGVKANIQEYTTKPLIEAGYEAHRKYIDIQYLISGEEMIKVRPLGELLVTRQYDGERDIMRLRDDNAPALELRLGSGAFAILYPEDAHEPGLQIKAPSAVKKVVVKVPVE